MRKAAIAGIRSFLPESVVTNEDLAAEFGDWDVEKIHTKTGISVRHIAGPDECSSDLGFRAAELLFESGICNKNEIDLILFCTQTPDHLLPSTACIVQDRLGLPTSVGAIDINLGCSGYVYGLSLAKGLIETGCADNVLLITADTYTKLIHPKDRSVRTIFGDGATATLIRAEVSEKDFLGPFVFGTDGAGAPNLIVPAGGLRNPVNQDSLVEKVDASGNYRNDTNLYMNGSEIFTFTLNSVPKLVEELLSRSGLTKDDVDHFVFHQANRFMLEALRKKIKIPEGKFCINMETYGNTVSSTIPMALELLIHNGEISSGDKIMLVGFGVGYSWAACMVEYL